MRAKDLQPGDRYGRLTFLEIIKDKKLTKSRCLCIRCKCDCGNIKEMPSSYWGRVKSCGCLRQEQYNKQLIDLTNQRFGKLTVLEKTNKKNNYGSYLWLCRCDCGNLKEISGAALRHHETFSCGCSFVSAGELKIIQILKLNNINFEQQKTFSTCIFPNTHKLAKFDFYLLDYNLLIEYDGIQHFQYRENDNFWNTKEEFEKRQYRDNYKNQWAKENNIKLKRIPYYDYDKIDLNYLLS